MINSFDTFPITGDLIKTTKTREGQRSSGVNVCDGPSRWLLLGLLSLHFTKGWQELINQHLPCVFLKGMAEIYPNPDPKCNRGDEPQSDLYVFWACPKSDVGFQSLTRYRP